jgi:hypothetical protein
VIARSTNSTAEQGWDYLYLIGRLIGFARQLDILMTEDTSVKLYFEQFMAACHMSPGGPYILKEGRR